MFAGPSATEYGRTRPVISLVLCSWSVLSPTSVVRGRSFRLHSCEGRRDPRQRTKDEGQMTIDPRRENLDAAGEPEVLPEMQEEPESRPGGIPLYVWVIASVVIAIPVGWAWGDGAVRLELLPKVILRALTALAAPLVVLAILSAIVTNEIRGRLGGLMMAFYLLNTIVAMIIGLTL